MLWLPILLMAATLILAESRRMARAEQGWMSLALPLVFAASALWFLGEIFLTVDMLALAADIQTGLAGFDAQNMRLNTAAFAVLGLGLFFSGAGRAAGRVAMADPQEPMVSIFLPSLAALAGLLLVAMAYLRL